MKLLLSHAYFLEQDKAEERIMMPYPPLGLLAVSAYLKRNDIEHQLYDTTFSNPLEFIDHIRKAEYTHLAFYVNLMTKVSLIDLMHQIRGTEWGKDICFILGGPDIRYNFKEYIAQGFDYLVVGEAEESLLDLLQNLKQRKAVDELQGIAFKKGNSIIQTDERALISDIDELPVPDRTAVSIDRYLKKWKDFHGFTSLNIYSQRGCPYTCAWCSKAVYGRSYRRRRASVFVGEIEDIQKEYNVDRLWIVDDVFTIDKSWLKDFQKELSMRKIKISYECISRADKMDSEIIRILKDTGCYRVWIGAESGAQRILNAMGRKVEAEDVRRVMKEVMAQGMEAGTFIMLGYPGEKLRDIKETVRHLRDAGSDLFTITMTYPIRGTELHFQVADVLRPQKAWEKSTERETDFERTYRKGFYSFAVPYVNHAVRMSMTNGSLRWRHAIKAIVTGFMMRLYQLF